MYTDKNFKTKKALKEALARGDAIYAYQPGGIFPANFSRGVVYLEGPHYPQAHTWYAEAKVDADGKILSVK